MVPAPEHKPVLDEETFQQLLAAAHTLQEQKNLLVAESASDYVQTLKDHIVENSQPIKVLPSTPEAVSHPNPAELAQVTRRVEVPEADGSRIDKVGATAFRASPKPPQCKRFPLRDELFWKIAIVAAVSAVLALALVASIHRFSPLPAGLSSTLEVAPPRAPFPSNKNIAAIPTQDCSVGTNNRD